MASFSKILIANRGEIAVRVIRACRELGIKAVAVYSEVDRGAMHVRLADEAYPIGPAPASQSYLQQRILIDAALQAGCEAVHPGYGFLAENAEFAAAVNSAGLAFIGSSPESIRLLGNKVQSRKKMVEAGVPVAPGIELDRDSRGRAKRMRAAEEIGFPVLIKAASGGGGKGMRVVQDPDELEKSIEAARRESKAAFGDDAVFLEKYIVNPRHVEFQIFGDMHGNRVHMFERECSIQRRHQKIIEESPAPALSDALRKRMGAAAVKVAEAAKYYNAGTVEFLLDADGSFYFLEVNTRIQVEHPVTETVLGIDLVALQILVAMGAELPWRQSNLSQRGHAIECRIYAEDAAAGFLPAAGTVDLLVAPHAPGVRFDNGVESGDEVTVHYDPIIAKLIASASTRDAALKRMRNALDETVILGLTTNIEFLKSVIDHPEYRAGRQHIGFIEENFQSWQTPQPSADGLHAAVALAAMSAALKSPAVNSDGEGYPDPWASLGAWQLGMKAE